MTTDPKKNDELKEKDLEGIAGGGDGDNHDETGAGDSTQPTGDYGEPFSKFNPGRV